MQQLKQYKKLLHINCTSACEGKNDNYVFEVRFEQAVPHSLFKYQVIKHKEEVKQLYQRLEEQIFAFENPFKKNVILGNLTKSQTSQKEEINASLEQCLQRIDVITHRSFIDFYGIHLHYEDFANCLSQEQQRAVEQFSGKNPPHEYKSQQSKHILFPGNSRSKEHTIENMPVSQSGKQVQKSSQSGWEGISNLVWVVQTGQLQLMNQTQILDFTLVRYCQNQLLYVLQQPRKTAKIKNFFKNVFSSSPSVLGYLSVHRKSQGKYLRNFSIQLLAEPISMSFVTSTNMILITTAVGVYIYLCKMETKLEEIEIFSYVELLGCVDCAHSSVKGEVYLLCSAQVGQLHVYSINQQKLMQTQYKYYEPSALCFQEQNSRLYVGDKEGVHVYSVVEYLDIRRLYTVKVNELYKSITINHGYLLCLSEKGFMTVIELKPPQKEKLLSVTTNISLPEHANKIVGSSKNRRLLVTHYLRSIVLIDTIEGPIFSCRLNMEEVVQSVVSDVETGTILSLTCSGALSALRLSPMIV